LVERFHRRLKEALQARCAGPDWLSHLPWVLLAIRTAAPLEGGLSPAEAVMGCQPILPGEFLAPANLHWLNSSKKFRQMLFSHPGQFSTRTRPCRPRCRRTSPRPSSSSSDGTAQRRPLRRRIPDLLRSYAVPHIPFKYK
jgi:hypothetical protein